MRTPLHIIAVPTKDLRADARAAITQLCIAAFQEEGFKHLFEHVPSDATHILAYDGNKALVSHALLTTRWLQPEGQPLLKTAYVDAVATLPALHGQGIGSAVMRHLASLISEYEIGGLKTERVSFYTRLGWEAWRGSLFGLKAGERVLTPEHETVMILRLPQTPRLDLDGVITIQFDGRFW